MSYEMAQWANNIKYIVYQLLKWSFITEKEEVIFYSINLARGLTLVVGSYKAGP